MISLCLHYKNRLPEIQASQLHQWSATCASYPHQQKGGAGSCTSHWRHLCHRWRADISWLPLWVCSWLDWASVGKVPKYIFNNLIRKRKKLFLSFKTHIESTFLPPFFSFFSCHPPFCLLWSLRISENASTIVCPVIDTIDWNTFEFYMQTDEPMIGGFDWRLTFQWHSVPEMERKRRKSRIDPIR